MRPVRAPTTGDDWLALTSDALPVGDVYAWAVRPDCGAVVLFSGTVVWMGALGLFVWGWRRRKRRAEATLQRWAHEEAAEDKLKRNIAERTEQGRIHIVLARGTAPANAPQMPPPLPDGGVPKVEHEGQWHTLH